MKKRLLLVVAIIFSLLTLAACGGSKDGASSDNKDKNKEILLWTSITGPDGDLIQKNIDRYNQTNPEYKVKLVAMEGSTFNNRLASVTRSGQGVPDIALIASENVNTYASQGMLVAWDDYINGTEVKAENYVDAAWNVGTYEGKQYGIPTTMGTWVMYYNKDLVDKYVPGAVDDGIVTYEEILKAGEAAKADGIYAYGFSWPMQNFNNLYLQMGGKFSADGKPTVNNDTAVQVFEQFKKLHDNGYMNKNGEDTTKLFKNGKIIFLPEGTWMVSTMKEITDFTWGETFTPQWDATKVVQASGADQLAMFVSKERSEAKIESTIKFIEWLQTNTVEWLQSGANPSSLAMLENEEYKDAPQSFLLDRPEVIHIVTDPGSGYIMSEIDTSAWDMIQGKVDIREKLKEIQKIVDDKMAAQ